MHEGPNAGVTLRDRRDAGLRLSERLGRYRGDDTVVVAVPRGGVLVAYEVAHRLGAPLEILVVERVSSSEDPGHTLGGVAGAGRVLDLTEIQSAGHSTDDLQLEIARAGSDAERRELSYREGRAPVPLGDRTVVLVLEGILTPVLARAAVQAIRTRGPRRIVIATGVCVRALHQELRREVDDVIVLREPEYVVSVGEWYQEFPPIDDFQVREVLRRAAAERVPRSSERSSMGAGSSNYRPSRLRRSGA